MSEPLAIKKSFLSSLIRITVIIALAELLVMVLLVQMRFLGILLSNLEEIVFDTLLLVMLSVPLLWRLSLKPLFLKIASEQQRSDDLAQLNAELRVALDAHALVSITDLQGRITHANEKFCKVSGYQLDELIGEDHRIINSGYHDRAFFKNLWHTLEHGLAWQGEICNRDKQGHMYWVDSTIVPLCGSDGRPLQYISIRREITALKKNEAKLTALKYALDASSEMILMTDAKGHIYYINPAFCTFSGWSEAEFIDCLPAMLDSPNGDQQILASMNACLLRGKSWSGRLLNRRKWENSDYWAEVHVTPIHDNDGKVSGYVQIQHDISDEVHRENYLQMVNADTAARLAVAAALQQPESLQERFRQVLVILFSLKYFDLKHKGGVFLKVAGQDKLENFVLSGEFSNMFSCRSQVVPFGACLCGRAAMSRELLVSDDCFCDSRHEYSYQGMVAHGHYIVPIVSGQEILGVMFLYTEPYPDQSEPRLSMLRQVGELMALAVLQEQAKNSLENARDTAVQAAKIKADFLANMSHEIRTPMSGILGMLDLLLDTELSREQTSLLATAASSAEALLGIINDILDFSKLEADKIELEQIEFNLMELVEDISVLMSAPAHNKGLALNCSVPLGAPVYWLGDPNRIRQVLVNLLSNAVKFTGQGEVNLTVTCQNSSDEGLFTITFVVADTGIGIAPENQGKLFQPFSQEDSSTARRFGGTGLGLSICKSLVAMMHGELGLTSSPGQGAQFWFSIPLPVSANLHSMAQDQGFSGKKALIIDGNASSRDILINYLHYWGGLVDVAGHGESALAQLRQHAYDLVLVDESMSAQEGCTLLKSLKEINGLANMPWLLLTTDSLNLSNCKAVGFTHSVYKPIRHQQLFEALVFACQGKSELPAAVDRSGNFPDYSGFNVLVVEDNKVNQKVLTGMLARFKVQVDLAENGAMALVLLAERNYDLVFMDCQMPVIDGYQACLNLRNQEQEQGKSRTPVIAITAHSADGEREKCLSAGMDGYLAKPFSRAGLASILGSWLQPLPVRQDGHVLLESANAELAANSQAISLPLAILNRSWDEQATLQKLGNDNELLDDMIALFIQEAPKQLIGLRNALTGSDWDGVAEVAHALKGMCGHFCAHTIGKLAADLEVLARSAKTEGLEVLIDGLEQAIGHLLASLQSRSKAG